MSENRLYTRIIQKHDTEAQWNLNPNLIPLKGELIVYEDGTKPKLKVGDGTTLVTNLPFISGNSTGAASTIMDDNLTANRALVSNSSGKVAVSAVTSTELGYLDGVTSNIQTQLNAITNLIGDKSVATQIANAIVVITEDEIDEICASTIDIDNPLVDEVTSKNYTLYVSSGNLKMMEVD